MAANLRPGTAEYRVGRSRVRTILTTARRLLIDEGAAALTMRRVAREVGISPGNLHYYYATRSDLLEDLLTDVIEGYLHQFDELRTAAGVNPSDQLRAVLEFVIGDLSTRDTTLFFPELWAMANREAVAAQQMEALYARYRAVLEELIGRVNPRLTSERSQALALFISASIEGQTMFIGHERPHSRQAETVKQIAVNSFLNLVQHADTARNDKPSSSATGESS